MYVSQPALSQYINRIEKQLNTKILKREKTPITLTETGEVYFNNLKKIITLQNKTTESINEIKNMKRGHIIIGSQYYQSAYLLANTLRKFSTLFPNINIQLIEDKTIKLEEFAYEGITDFSISMLPTSAPNLTVTNLMNEEVYICCSVDHPLAKSQNIKYPQYGTIPELDLFKLKDQKFIAQNKDLRLRRSFNEICDVIGETPEIVSETNDVTMAQILASTGFGVSLIPDILAHQTMISLPAIYFRPKPNLKTRNVVAVYNSLYSFSKPAEAFLNLLKSELTSY